MVEPKLKGPDRPSNLSPFAEILAACLRAEVAKSRKQRRTALQMHFALVSLGYVGSCGRVAAFVPLAFARGEAFQLDWS
jgi:hypothetical protein